MMDPDGCSIRLAEGWDKKIGSASAWARFLIIYIQCRHRAACLGGVEWESPKARAVVFPPPLEDDVPIRMDDRHSHLGEGNLAA